MTVSSVAASYGAAGLVAVSLLAALRGLIIRPPHRLIPTSASGIDGAASSASHRRRRVPPRQVAGIAGAAVVGLLLGPIPTLAIAGAGWFARRWRRVRREAAAQRSRVLAVPELIDLLVVMIDAGLTPPQAIRRAAVHGPPQLLDDLGTVISRLDVGERLADALQTLVDNVGGAAAVLAETIKRTEVYGDPLGPLLLRLHDDATRQRRIAGESAARELPIRMCFPLVCCTLPSFVLLTIVPLLAGAFSSLRQGTP